MYDETIRQTTLDQKRFPDLLKEKGIEVGIKVDQGLEFFNGSDVEQVTKGLDGLRDRLVEYRALYGATFTKWRVALHIHTDNGLPSEACMIENAERLAQYAKIVQEENMVPIIEPEILIEGDHTIDTCYAVTAKNLDIVFQKMEEKGVVLSALILKTSMVLSGNHNPAPASVVQVAQLTIKCLREHVPHEIGGIVFLSGGQSSILATQHLNAMHQLDVHIPWPLTFSYSRAIQHDTLEYWSQHRNDVFTAQQLLVAWAQKNSLASLGIYESSKS
jgi:fructose-bisphosphate aldolase class I